MSPCTTIPTIRLVRPAKTQISLCIHALLSEYLLIACAFYSLQAIQSRMKKNPCHTGWLYSLIWVFAGHTGLIVGFVLRGLKYNMQNIQIKPNELGDPKGPEDKNYTENFFLKKKKKKKKNNIKICHLHY